LGNVWRFPYLCFKHGGGAFLIPYAIMLAFIGIPCFFMEITIGQYSAMGPVTIYSNLSPLFKGLGFANFMASCVVGLYYNMIIAWTIYYLFASFTSKLPWDTCQNDFNSPFCFNINDYRNCTDARLNGTISEDAIYFLGRCLTEEDTDYQTIQNDIGFYYNCSATEVYINSSHCGDIEDFPDKLFDIPNGRRESAASEYLKLEVLKESDGIENMGAIQWKLCLCLLAAWIVIFLCLVKGIQSSGKVVYFTATFPYFVLIILLIKAATLPGAIDGIRFYMIPDLSRLSDIKVWEAAAVQIFFSLSVAGGGLITLASYNKFHNNVIRDTFIVCIGNCLTSVVAGFAIFSVLGFMAGELGVDVRDVATSGTGLAFVAYPDLVTRLPGAPFWAILFFAMLFTLGLDSQFAIVETILTGVMDFEPRLRRFKTPLVAVICTIGFLCGLPLTTEGGGYLLDLLDYYGAGWPYLFIGLTELIILSHIYGIQNFLDDVKRMIKIKTSDGKPTNLQVWGKSVLFFIFTTLSPLIISVILIVSWSSHEPLTKGDYVYPGWANDLGWAIAMIAICAVPFVALVQVCWALFKEYQDKRNFTNFGEIMTKLTRHTDAWRQNEINAQNEVKAEENGNGYDNKAAIVD